MGQVPPQHVYTNITLGKETEIIAAMAKWWAQDGSMEFSISVTLNVLFPKSDCGISIRTLRKSRIMLIAILEVAC